MPYGIWGFASEKEVTVPPFNQELLVFLTKVPFFGNAIY